MAVTGEGSRSPTKLVLTRDNAEIPSSIEIGGCEVSPFESRRVFFRRHGLRRSIHGWDEVWIVVPNLGALRRPFLTRALAYLCARRRAILVDSSGKTSPVGIASLIRSGVEFLRDLLLLPGLLLRTNRDVQRLSSVALPKAPELSPLTAETRSEIAREFKSPLYLRTDMVLGLRSGGAVGHIAGVLNSFVSRGLRPTLFSTSPIPTVDEGIDFHRFELPKRMWNLTETPLLACSCEFAGQVERECADRKFDFIYQRSSVYNYCGLALAERMGIPLVTEYNSPVVWINRYWANPLRYEALAKKIERANLLGSNLVVVVSSSLRDRLVEDGVPSSRILVNPNGVNVEMYSPDIDGSQVRNTYQLGSETVVGFIGTFGNWHGAEVLAEAFGQILEQEPERRDDLRLLMVGSGKTLPLVEEVVDRYGIRDLVVLTGTVPQAEGPNYLAACDILVSPQTPNADGSTFFGSPTKMFEYMAMGRGIVASDLGQIGEVLTHRETAILVDPGDAKDLARGIRTLIDDVELRERLGSAARKEAVEKHTWARHVDRIMEALEGRAP